MFSFHGSYRTHCDCGVDCPTVLICDREMMSNSFFLLHIPPYVHFCLLFIWLPIYIIVNILKWDFFFLWQNLRHDNDLTSEICDIYSATTFVAILFTYVVVKNWQSRGFCQSCKFQEPKLSIIIDLPIFSPFDFTQKKFLVLACIVAAAGILVLILYFSLREWWSTTIFLILRPIQYWDGNEEEH